jgi:hypothetical protein
MNERSARWVAVVVSALLASASLGCSDSDSADVSNAAGSGGSGGSGAQASGGSSGSSLGGNGGAGAGSSGGSAGTAGAAGAAPKWQFFAFGDTRSNASVFQKNIESMAALDPAAVALFNGGDLTATGTASEWDTHHKVLADGAPDPSVPVDPSGIIRQSKFRTDVNSWGSHVRYIGVLGNHDDGSTGWLNRWNSYLSGQATLGKNGTDGIYFSLSYENAWFVVLDAINTSSAQTSWLAAELDSAEAQQATFKLAFFHRPVYPCNDKTPFSGGLPWVELFEQHGVDIAFVADSHTYERTCAMQGGGCAQSGVVYLNTSGGGAPVRPVNATKQATVTNGSRSDSYDCAKILESSRGNWYHFTHIAIDGCKLTLDAHSHDQVDTGSAPFDTLVIDKCGG